jgi:hypothetical protein
VKSWGRAGRLVAVGVVGLMPMALSACSSSNTHGGARPPSSSAVSQAGATHNPPVFLTVDGGSFSLDVRSVQTGSVVRTLADNVGQVALNPDGFVAYYQSGPPQGPGIVSVPVTGGTPVLVASGTAPAVSPDSSKLAFALPGAANVVGIYDVDGRTTQRVDVTQLVGAGYHLDNTGSLLAWVSNTLLVVISLQDATTFAFERSAGVASAQLTSAEPPAQKAVLINLAHANSAQLFDISLSGGIQGVGGPGPSPGILLVATQKAIDRFMVTPSSITSLGSVPIPNLAIVQALSPDGLKALYLLPGGASSPPLTAAAGGVATSAPPAPYQSSVQLWEATIGTTLKSSRLVFDNAQLHGAAW